MSAARSIWPYAVRPAAPLEACAVLFLINDAIFEFDARQLVPPLEPARFHAISLSYVIDLGEVSSMDSSALGMLLLLREHAGADRAEIRIVNADTSLRGTLRVAGFDKLFVLH